MRDRVVRHVVSQFHRPRGALGRLAGRIMSTRGSNVERNLWLIDELELKPDHRVLEIGAGPGVALAAAAETVTRGQLVAVDHSATMLRQAAARNQGVLRQGRLRLVEAPAEHLPADLHSFDRIYAMNVWHFWDDQDAVVADLADRLSVGGRLAIGLQPRGPAGLAPGVDEAEEQLVDQLERAGLAVVARRRLELRPTPAVLVVGQRPPAAPPR